MSETKTDLQARYEAVHAAILAGPNAQLQEWVDSGLAWHLEGAVGRAASDALAAGALVLGPNPRRDYWGSGIPAYDQVTDEVGAIGSVANAEAYEEDER
jgi:hypothetical protein